MRVALQDGTVIYSNSGPVGGAQFPYRFTVQGNYTVTATATDANGSTATATTIIIVNP